VLFTSGSTGEPKGVEVPHSAAAATIDAIAGRFGITADDRLIALSALEFDLSVFDLFAALGVGGALVCLDEAGARDAAAWTELIARHGVTIANAAPGLVAMLADTAMPAEIASLRLILTGGDRVDTAVGAKLRAAVPGLRFVGLGGTTETAIHSTVCELTDDTPDSWTHLPYGKPLDGVALRVVNGRGGDCPEWVPGEIWIGGRGVARGYRGDPARTAERFTSDGAVRWYRTGDLGRYLPGGIVDFLGRRDHQVKIRGYRVELGEVEAALLRQPGVTGAIAAVLDGPRLAAAIAAERPLAEADVRAALAELLPGYMVPELIEIRSSLPVTRNGKTDRAAVAADLAAAASGRVRDAHTPPVDDIEAAVEYLMAALLEVERLGVETDFFAAGGNSILATVFVAKARGLLLASGIGVADVFDARTARATAALMRERGDAEQLQRVCSMLLEVAAG
jgi:mycobactin phenyloxazoline synthetase